jgi:hypothetical protein
VTEKEVQKGILTYEERIKKTCVFFRDINEIDKIDLKEKSQVELARRFFDMKGSKRDVESEILIKEMRNKINNTLKDTDNVILLPAVNWSKKSGVSYLDHKEHVEMFGLKFQNEILKLIENSEREDENFMKNLIDQDNKDFLAEIIRQQALLRIKNSKLIIGREKEENLVRIYIYLIFLVYL